MDNLGGETRYVLMLALPREVEDALESALLQQPGVTRPVMGYHVSVLGPFTLRPGATPEALDAARRVCAARGPLSLRLAGLAVYVSEAANLLVVPVTPVARLRSLHTALRAALGGVIALQRDFPPASYRPHVTLGLHVSEAQVAMTLRLASETSFAALFTATALSLAEQRSWGAWRVVAEYPFRRLAAR